MQSFDLQFCGWVLVNGGKCCSGEGSRCNLVICHYLAGFQLLEGEVGFGKWREVLLKGGKL